jgi:hypothetical protein
MYEEIRLLVIFLLSIFAYGLGILLVDLTLSTELPQTGSTASNSYYVSDDWYDVWTIPSPGDVSAYLGIGFRVEAQTSKTTGTGQVYVILKKTSNFLFELIIDEGPRVYVRLTINGYSANSGYQTISTGVDYFAVFMVQLSTTSMTQFNGVYVYSGSDHSTVVASATDTHYSASTAGNWDLYFVPYKTSVWDGFLQIDFDKFIVVEDIPYTSPNPFSSGVGIDDLSLSKYSFEKLNYRSVEFATSAPVDN